MKTTASASMIRERGDRTAGKQDSDGCGELNGQWLRHFKALRNNA
jgi:hypothetical protein